MTKILVAGIGGVGGYFGGMLARAFADNQDVEISFLARGEHLHEIRKNGLTVQEDDLQIVSAKIIDVSGRETLAATQSQLTNGIDVDRLSNGMYFVRMILEDGKTSLQKIAIAK